MQLFPPFMTRADTRFWRAMALVLPVVLIAVMLSQNVTAKTTYVITDGDQVITHSSYSTDPEYVLDEAGFELSDLDLYTTQETDGVSEITVRRSQAITIHYCGQVIRTSTYGETLAQLLQRLGISYEGTYQMSVPANTQTYDGMEVTVDWIHSNPQSYTVDIPYETSYVNDPTMEDGEQRVVVEGQVGQMLCTANVSYSNGVETGRIVTEEKVVAAPVTQIIAVGTGKAEQGKPADQVLFGDGYIVLPTGEVLTYTHSEQYKATAYTSWIEDVTGTTATGTKARVGAIAVDPKLIPYGTRMFIVTNDGEYVYGIATAEDCGGGVRGNHVDLFFDTVSECFEFGIRQCTIYFLGDADRLGPQNR